MELEDEVAKDEASNGQIKEDQDAFALSAEQYAADGSAKALGTENPSIMMKPFWKYMIHTRESAWGVRGELRAETVFPPWEQLQADDNADDNAENESGELDGEENVPEELAHLESESTPEFTGPRVESPIWCFQRFGQTETKLSDGRIVYIGGEHEDFYDPDFFIYNDVVVFDSTTDALSPKDITIYGYPTDIFPPTDFHTATLYQDPDSGKQSIYIIGGLGYMGGPHRIEINVYRLDLADFSIHKVETGDSKPERTLDRHKAELVDGPDGLKSIVRITTSNGDSFDEDEDESETEDDVPGQLEHSVGGSSTSSDSVKGSIQEESTDADSADSDSLTRVDPAEEFVAPATPPEKAYLLDLRTLEWSTVEL